MKRTIPVIAGVFTGMAVIFIIELIGHKLFPITMNLDTATDEAKANFMKNIPTGAMAVVIIAWALGALGAGIVSTLVSKDHTSSNPALISGGILFVLGIINMITIPHPIWFWIAGVLVYLPFAWLGFKIAKSN